MEIVVVYLIFAAIVGVAASNKGRSGFGWFLLAVVISPILGLILILVIGPGAKGATVRANNVATLSSLADLRDRGVLTEDEFQAKKAALLAKV